MKNTAIMIAVGGAASLVLAGAASAQLSIDVEMYSQGSRVNPDQASEAVLFDCSQTLVDLGSFGSIDLSFSGSTNGNFSVSVGAEIATTPEQFAQNVLDNLIDEYLPNGPCTFGFEQNLGRLYGSMSLYSVAGGGGPQGGFQVTRRATTTISYDDTFDITSGTARTVEVPLHISGSLVAAESFGDIERTRAVGTMTLAGSLGGESFGETVAVESVSVIPEQASIDVTRVVTVTLTPGVTSIPISVVGFAEGEATGVSAGFFGTIVGAATMGVTFPNTITIGRFRGAGNTPLPRDVVIRSRASGKVVQQGAPLCVADVDDGTATGTPDGGVTIDDLLYYLGLFEVGAAAADVDDGTATGTPDGGVTIDDLLYFLARFEAGC